MLSEHCWNVHITFGSASANIWVVGALGKVVNKEIFYQKIA